MQYEDIWQIQDEITSAVNSLGYSLWDLHYDRQSFSFHLELNEHLPDEVLTYFCSQMPLPTDYDGEGSHGSVFTLYTHNQTVNSFFQEHDTDVPF